MANEKGSELAYTAACYLHEGGETDALELLLLCDVEFEEGVGTYETFLGSEPNPDVVRLRTGRKGFDELNSDFGNSPGEQIRDAFRVASGGNVSVVAEYKPGQAPKQPWMDQLEAVAPGLLALPAEFVEQ